MAVTRFCAVRDRDTCRRRQSDNELFLVGNFYVESGLDSRLECQIRVVSFSAQVGHRKAKNKRAKILELF